MTALPLHFQLDPRSGIPAYRQLMDQIQYYQASGVLAAGDQLPSIREMAKGLQVNPATVVKAYTELEHQGVLERQQGRGVFLKVGAKSLSAKEKEEALRRMARQLVVEARQMGTSVSAVQKLVADEWKTLKSSGESFPHAA